MYARLDIMPHIVVYELILLYLGETKMDFIGNILYLILLFGATGAGTGGGIAARNEEPASNANGLIFLAVILLAINGTEHHHDHHPYNDRLLELAAPINRFVADERYFAYGPYSGFYTPYPVYAYGLEQANRGGRRF
jgi:hypothetical protein